ncbi:MAG: squalene/phytoene synthase family protein, partial [Myxococcota bacterium]
MNNNNNTHRKTPWRNGELRALEEGFQSAIKVTRHHAKSFYFCSVALPQPKRRAAYAVYAFCRHVDDAVDECEGDRTLAAQRIAAIGRLLDRVYDRDPGLEAVWKAFSMTVAAYAIPRSYFEVLIRGVMMDLEPVHYDTWDELDDYCFHVAGVVGLIMTRIFGV